MPSRPYVVGERLKCIGGKYQGAIVFFVKTCPKRIQVRFGNGVMRYLAPENLERCEAPRTETMDTLLALLCVQLERMNLEQFEQDDFAVAYNEVVRSAFS